MSNRICIIFFKSIRNIQFYSKINRINFLSFNKILNRCRKILNNFGQPECIGISSAVFSKISRNDLSKNVKNNFCIWNQLDIWSQLALQMYIFNFADSCQKIMITRTKIEDDWSSANQCCGYEYRVGSGSFLPDPGLTQSRHMY